MFDYYINKLSALFFFTEMANITRSCVHCKKNASLQCSRCSEAHYCSVPCQRTHWKIHKPICATIVDAQKHTFDGTSHVHTNPTEKLQQKVPRSNKEFKQVLRDIKLIKISSERQLRAELSEMESVFKTKLLMPQKEVDEIKKKLLNSRDLFASAFENCLNNTNNDTITKNTSDAFDAIYAIDKQIHSTLGGESAKKLAFRLRTESITIIEAFADRIMNDAISETKALPRETQNIGMPQTPKMQKRRKSPARKSKKRTDDEGDDEDEKPDQNDITARVALLEAQAEHVKATDPDGSFATDLVSAVKTRLAKVTLAEAITFIAKTSGILLGVAVLGSAYLFVADSMGAAQNLQQIADLTQSFNTSSQLLSGLTNNSMELISEIDGLLKSDLAVLLTRDKLLRGIINATASGVNTNAHLMNGAKVILGRLLDETTATLYGASTEFNRTSTFSDPSNNWSVVSPFMTQMFGDWIKRVAEASTLDELKLVAVQIQLTTTALVGESTSSISAAASTVSAALSSIMTSLKVSAETIATHSVELDNLRVVTEEGIKNARTTTVMAPIMTTIVTKMAEYLGFGASYVNAAISSNRVIAEAVRAEELMNALLTDSREAFKRGFSVQMAKNLAAAISSFCANILTAFSSGQLALTASIWSAAETGGPALSEYLSDVGEYAEAQKLDASTYFGKATASVKGFVANAITTIVDSFMFTTKAVSIVGAAALSYTEGSAVILWSMVTLFNTILNWAVSGTAASSLTIVAIGVVLWFSRRQTMSVFTRIGAFAPYLFPLGIFVMKHFIFLYAFMCIIMPYATPLFPVTLPWPSYANTTATDNVTAASEAVSQTMQANLFLAKNVTATLATEFIEQAGAVKVQLGLIKTIIFG